MFRKMDQKQTDAELWRCIDAVRGVDCIVRTISQLESDFAGSKEKDRELEDLKDGLLSIAEELLRPSDERAPVGEQLEEISYCFKGLVNEQTNFPALDESEIKVVNAALGILRSDDRSKLKGVICGALRNLLDQVNDNEDSRVASVFLFDPSTVKRARRVKAADGLRTRTEFVDGAVVLMSGGSADKLWSSLEALVPERLLTRKMKQTKGGQR